ncbi:hypothetical protein [Burkholderia gladioli]|uniref:hypothetical protein n=1 Tax=Burkholderia gladioli TaxID=28095 RepID=UPI0022D78FE2|nr:hypothetical protein [Burkholderia gladioli]MDA0570482.1 hypothetical protein [Burkholderia gladioli]MDA0598457.1 hypothetical protein [Burkholderia gladioli]
MNVTGTAGSARPKFICKRKHVPKYIFAFASKHRRLRGYGANGSAAGHQPAAIEIDRGRDARRGKRKDGKEAGEVRRVMRGGSARKTGREK